MYHPSIELMATGKPVAMSACDPKRSFAHDQRIVESIRRWSQWRLAGAPQCSAWSSLERRTRGL